MDAIDPTRSQDLPSRVPPNLLARKIILAALAVGFILLYVLGVFVRNSRGIRVIVHNESGTNLKNAKVTLESGAHISLVR